MQVIKKEVKMNVIKDERGRTRVKIVQAAGTEVLPGVIAADPEESVPHHEKLGWMEEVPCDVFGGRGNPRIELDDGSVLWGYECWWDYVKADPSA